MKKMKITKFLLVMFLVITAVSCNKDDDGGEVAYTLSTTNFVDTYSMNFLELKVVETVTLGSGSTTTETTTTKGSSFSNVNFVFNSDKTFNASGLYISIVKTVNSNGTTTSDPTPADASTEIGSGIYSLNTSSNNVTITDGNGRVIVFEVRNYTETSMTLYAEETETVGNTTLETTIEYRFTR